MKRTPHTTYAPVLDTRRHPRARLIRRLLVWQRIKTNDPNKRQEPRP